MRVDLKMMTSSLSDAIEYEAAIEGGKREGAWNIFILYLLFQYEPTHKWQHSKTSEKLSSNQPLSSFCEDFL